jgi:hypothetical protein
MEGKGIPAMTTEKRLLRLRALALAVAGLVLSAPAVAQDGSAHQPGFSDGLLSPPAGHNARFGVILRPDPLQEAMRRGQGDAGALAPVGRVAFGARIGETGAVSAHIGLGDLTARDPGHTLRELPLTLGFDYGDLGRFLLSGEVVLPTRLRSGEVRGRVSSGTVRVNASFRF